jgi:O-methyltransferase
MEPPLRLLLPGNGVLAALRLLLWDRNPDLGPEVRTIIERVKPVTMSGPERIAALYEATRYIARNKIEGDFVECGVWKGGSMMVAALTLLGAGPDRPMLHLFDTYEGMTAPTDVDRSSLSAATAAELLANNDKSARVWAYSPLDEVRRNLASTGYPSDRLKFVMGRVEDTLPSEAPDKISLLRLDTDWYESTKHELTHLFPRLVAGGVLIVDDYGHWAGSKKAVDEYIEEQGIALLLNRIDYTGRIAVKGSH